MKLLVRNLDRSTTEKELGELFQEFGAKQRVCPKASGLLKCQEPETRRLRWRTSTIALSVAIQFESRRLKRAGH